MRIWPLLLLLGSGGAGAEEPPLSRIAFGSCMKENRPAPIFSAIVAAKPQLFIWMGDNIYADTADPAVFEEKYRRLKNHPDYLRLQRSVPVIGTWDDHDYGRNDAGRDFPAKKIAQEKFLDFFDVPVDSPRRRQAGVYASADYGPPGKRVRVILLDTRYHREAPGAEADILGDEQWRWLERQALENPADLHLLVSSIQVLPTEHRFEKWANFPAARERLLELLRREEAPPTILLSGDRHLAEISVDRDPSGEPLYEITSSSLNASFGGNPEEENRLRLGANYGGTNFGTITIDWYPETPVVTLAIRDVNGAPQRAVTCSPERR